jgi:NADH:ubiquinone oxidoreductase subunit 5 (subunit L)/multisubunit Na+/H+ antiporter MnhA subunit
MSLALTLLIIPLLPFCGAAVNGLLGKRFSQRQVNFVALAPVSLSFMAVLYAVGFLFYLGPHPGIYRFNYFNWIQSGQFSRSEERRVGKECS